MVLQTVDLMCGSKVEPYLLIHSLTRELTTTKLETHIT